MFAQAESRGDVIVRVAEGIELQNLGAGAFFDYTTRRPEDNNKMVIVIDPAWVSGAGAQLAASSVGSRASVLNVFGHEFDHYMRVAAFKDIDRLQDLSYRPELSAEQRFELYSTQRMQVEVQGWFAGLRTFRAELSGGNTQAGINELDQRRLTNVEKLLLDVEAQGRRAGLSGTDLDAYISEKGAAVLSRNTAYWDTYVQAMSHVSGVNTDAVRQRLAFRLDQPDDVLEWSEQGGEGTSLTLNVRYRNGERLEETQNPDLTGQSIRRDANDNVLEKTLITVESNGSRTFTTENEQGAITSTRNVQTFDDGSRIETTATPDGKVIAQSFDTDLNSAGTITDTPDGAGGINRVATTVVNGKEVEITQHANATDLAADSDNDGDFIDAGDFDTTDIDIDIDIDGDDAVNSDLLEDAIDDSYQSASDIIRAPEFDTNRNKSLICIGQAVRLPLQQAQLGVV